MNATVLPMPAPPAVPGQSMEEPPQHDPGPPAEMPDVNPESQGIPIPLGHDRGVFFYLSRATGQVHGMTAAQHGENGFKAIASSAHVWERIDRFKRKNSVAWPEVTDWLMTECHKAGVFDRRRIRGRGAWFDAGRVVLHTGAELIVGGDAVDLTALDTKYIYERGVRLRAPIDARPLNNAEAHKLIELCDMLPWASSASGKLFAGWLVLAPVCGALQHRPHGWLIGASGSGKTYAQEEIVKPMLGGLAVEFSSKTTEAAVRGGLQSDALPTLMDEFETQNLADRIRAQQVIDLGRPAYQEGSAPIGKGTREGGVRAHAIRTMFLWSAINAAATQGADENRSLFFELVPRNDPEAFDGLKKFCTETITPAFAAGMLARMLKLIPVIRKNAETLAALVAKEYGSRRQGDTYGTVLAGAHALHSDREITADQARALVMERRWVVETLKAGRITPEHERALARLVEHRLRVQPRTGPAVERSVAELIVAARSSTDDIESLNGISGLADAHLARAGLRWEAEWLWIAQGHDAVDRVFRDTPWADTWRGTLLRTPGAIKSEPKSKRFGAVVKKAIGIPLSTALHDGEE